MPLYKVIIKEVHISTRIIEANHEDDALDSIFEGADGDEISCVFSHTLEEDDSIEVKGSLSDGEIVAYRNWQKLQEKKDG